MVHVFMMEQNYDEPRKPVEIINTYTLVHSIDTSVPRDKVLMVVEQEDTTFVVRTFQEQKPSISAQQNQDHCKQSTQMIKGENN